MRGHRGLRDYSGMLWIDAGGDEKRGNLAVLGAQLIRLLVNRDRMEIDNTEDALIVILDLDPVFEGSEIIADMEISRGLNPG
jgi:hypothetical protein